MKIILNERQYNVLYLLKEGDDILSNYKQTIGDVNKKLNIAYTRIISISIAEIPKFSDELAQLKNQLSSYDDIISTAYSKMTYFINNQISQQDFDSKWSQIDIEIDGLKSVSMNKLNGLESLVDSLIGLNNLNIFELFQNVKPIEISN